MKVKQQNGGERPDKQQNCGESASRGVISSRIAAESAIRGVISSRMAAESTIRGIISSRMAAESQSEAS